MKNLPVIFLLLVCINYFSGCGRNDVVNDPVITLTEVQGAYILGEGQFNVPGSALLSFYNPESVSLSPNIFHPGGMGNSPDGLILSGSNLFITEQGNYGSAGKIYMTDSAGTVILSNDVGINPYSLAIANNKIYVTNGPANNVSVVDKGSFSTIATVTVGLYPQEIFTIGNKVFVCNTSVYMGGTDSTVSVIDADADVVIATIRVRQTPSSLAVTNDGKLLVGCPGSTATGIIYKIDPGNYAILDSFGIGNGFSSGFGKDIAVDVSSNDIYFISALNNIVKLNLATKLSELFIANTNSSSYFYGYNFDSNKRLHYIADAKNFVNNGSLYVYGGAGNLIGTFETGVAPRRILIKN